MSEVVRSMSRGERYSQPAPERRLSGGFRITRWLVLLIAVGCVYGWWVSRDTHEFRPFITSDPAAVVVVQRGFQNQADLFEAPSWKALPESARAHPVPAMFTTRFDAPDWLLRNLFGQHVLCVAPSGTDYEDAIYLSKMSRFGVLIERALRRSSNNNSDIAGGLRLRYLEEHDLYYAVRGRLMIGSSSRRALIRALTLDDSEQIASENWDESIWDVGAEDVRGTIRLSEESRWGGYFAGIGFALRLDSEEAVLKLKMPCTDAFYSEFLPTLEGKGATRLYTPEAGPIRFSADVGAGVSATFAVLEEVLELPDDADEPWLTGLLERDEDPAIALLLQDAGSAVARTWHGYVLDDIAPDDITSTIVTVNSGSIAETIASAPTELDGSYQSASMKRDPERSWLEVATVGGPALTHVVAMDASGRTALVSTSRLQAELNGWGDDSSAARLEGQGNLYLAIDPGAVLTELEALVSELETGFAITTVQAIGRNDEIARWREQMRSIKEIELVAEHDPDARAIQATLTVR